MKTHPLAATVGCVQAAAQLCTPLQTDTQLRTAMHSNSSTHTRIGEPLHSRRGNLEADALGLEPVANFVEFDVCNLLYFWPLQPVEKNYLVESVYELWRKCLRNRIHDFGPCL